MPGPKFKATPSQKTKKHANRVNISGTLPNIIQGDWAEVGLH